MLARVDDFRFFLLALPALMRAAWRLWRFGSRYRLDRLAVELRRVPRFRHRPLADPQRLAACAERWVRGWHRLRRRPWQGPCYLRSLLLLDLWSRCGLHPELRLGVVRDHDTQHLHAWVVTDGGPCCGVSGHAVVWTG